MQSLEVSACLKLVQSKSLAEIIEFTNRKRGGLPAQICDSPMFWKGVIDRFYGKILLLQRQDVDPNDYRKFAKSLANGQFTLYQTMTNLATPETKVFDPREIHDLDDDTLIDDGDDMPINFKILGSKPNPGTVGYVVDYNFETSFELRRTVQRCYLARSREELAEAEFNFKYDIGSMMYEDLVAAHEDGQDITLFGFNVPFLAMQEDSPEFKEEFLRLFVSQPLKEDENLLTEFNCRFDPDLDESYVQVWVVKVTF